MNIAVKYLDQIRENKGIEYQGLVFYPLEVRHFALYQSAKPAFELMQSSLPPALARLSWMPCLDALDKKSRAEGRETDFLISVLRVMAVSLRLETMYDPRKPEVRCWPIFASYTQDGNLSAVCAGVNGTSLLNMQQMDEVRRIIAAQNGYELPDENWNVDLVKAQRYTDQQKQRKDIVPDLETLVYSVALNAHVKAEEVWGWTLRDFFMTQAAIERTLNYQIYTAAELSRAVKFKHGNPFPTWKYERNAELPSSFVKLGDLDAGAKGLLGEAKID